MGFGIGDGVFLERGFMREVKVQKRDGVSKGGAGGKTNLSVFP
jgi:hypothetical protein